MTLYMSPPKLSISTDYERSLPSSSGVTHDPPTSKQKGTVLYKTFSPRRKIDQFGLDQTDYKAYCLSSTVFPTAVKTTLLGDLQDTNPHTCGFDIVERPNPRKALSFSSQAQSVINTAPPPTAVTSQRSTHSAPIVAFVEVPSGENMPGTCRTSVISKSTANSQVNSHSEFTMRENNNNIKIQNGYNEGENIDRGGASENGHHNNAMFSLNSNSEHVIHKQDAIARVKQENCNDSDPIKSWSSANEDGVAQMVNRLRKTFEPPAPTSSTQPISPRVTSYARFDERRLTRYHWKSRDIRNEEDNKDGGDIRDPLYINTFCSDERPVRFNKISLPSISRRTSRQRPWTVSESNISARTAKLMTKRSNNFPNVGRFSMQNFRNVKHGANGGVTKSAGHINARKNAWRDSVENAEKDTNDDICSGSPGGKPLLEIRSFLTADVLSDQREKIKGKNGCLNSRVKQCVRFVRYRERLDRQEDNYRPLKAEHGKYRPFSKTDVRDHYVSNPAPTPELKLQQSVETYQKYVENIARQTNIMSPKQFSFQSSSNTTSGVSRLRGAKTISPSNFDEDSVVVQAIMDSNRPELTSALQSRGSSDTPRPQNSAIYTKDVSAVGQALDIKHISPVPTVNRVVPGTRGVVIQRMATPRIASASTEDGEREAEHSTDPADNAAVVMSPHHHVSTIIVPRVTKSECASEYSVSKDD